MARQAIGRPSTPPPLATRGRHNRRRRPAVLGAAIDGDPVVSGGSGLALGLRARRRPRTPGDRPDNGRVGAVRQRFSDHTATDRRTPPASSRYAGSTRGPPYWLPKRRSTQSPNGYESQPRSAVPVVYAAGEPDDVVTEVDGVRWRLRSSACSPDGHAAGRRRGGHATDRRGRRDQRRGCAGDGDRPAAHRTGNRAWHLLECVRRPRTADEVTLALKSGNFGPTTCSPRLGSGCE